MSVRPVSKPDLTQLLTPFLEEGEKEKIPLALVAFKKAAKAIEERAKAREQAEIALYQSVLSGISPEGLEIEAPKTLFLQQGNSQKETQCIDVIGSGGSKIAVKISNDKALIAPISIPDWHNWEHIRKWKKLMAEELEMSQLFQSHGLLTAKPEPVQVALSPRASRGTASLFIAETFQSLAKNKGLFVLEPRRSASVWKKGENFLFPNDEERLKAASWDPVLDPLLTDIAKISLYDLPVLFDSNNFAVLKKSSENGQFAPSFEVRFFGFDFEGAKLNMKEKDDSPSAIEQRADHFLNRSLNEIFRYEFPSTFYSDNVSDLKQELLDKYLPIILKRVEGLKNDSIPLC